MSSQGFLSRWSQRKLNTEQEASPLEAQPAVELVEEAQADLPIAKTPEENSEEQVQQEALVADLPDIETLTEESDFSAFMQQGVPEELKKMALRKLWRSNPVFANLDGLNDYDEDFTIITPLAEGLAEELKKLMKENSRTTPKPEPEAEVPEPEAEVEAEQEEKTEGDVPGEQEIEGHNDEDELGEGEDE